MALLRNLLVEFWRNKLALAALFLVTAAGSSGDCNNSIANQDWQSPSPCENYRFVKDHFGRDKRAVQNLEFLEKYHERVTNAVTGLLTFTSHVAVEKLKALLIAWASDTVQQLPLGVAKAGGRAAWFHPEALQTGLHGTIIVYLIFRDLLHPKALDGPEPAEYYLKHPLRLVRTQAPEAMVCGLLEANSELADQVEFLKAYAEAEAAAALPESDGSWIDSLRRLEMFLRLRDETEAADQVKRLENVLLSIESMNEKFTKRIEEESVETTGEWQSPTVRRAEALGTK